MRTIAVASVFAIVSCAPATTPRVLPRAVAPEPHSKAPPASPPAAAPWHTVGVRVLAATFRGAMPSDEEGTWDLRDAANIVANMNAGARETGLTFALERAEALAVDDERYSKIATTSAGDRAATLYYVSTGHVTNTVIDVVVVNPEPATFVGGWGETDAPLRTLGVWPVITISTRVARSREPHWITHELGHVLGFYDTTYYEAVPRINARYTRCGLSVATTTYAKASAPLGARENFMSYDVDKRRSFFTDGYDPAYRNVIACWARTSGL